jgi:hypothetical protein
MITKFLLIGATGLLLVTGGAKAQPNATDQAYRSSIAAQAEARLANAGVKLPGVIRVSGSLSGDLLSGVQVAATGDFNLDHAVREALRHMPLGQVPAELSGRTVKLTLGPAPLVQAQSR